MFPKGRKDWVAKPIRKEKSYRYVYDMMHQVIKAKLEKKKLEEAKVPKKIPSNIAPTPRPQKDVIIARHKSRFNK